MDIDGGAPDLGSAVGQLRIQRSSTAEQAADVIRSLILEGKLGPGVPLRETHLAEAVGVSRNTMREALRIVGREGLISQDRHHVATVARLGAHDVREIYGARHVLEAGAIMLVKNNGLTLDLQPLKRDCDRLSVFRDDEPWLTVIDADRDFHVHMVQLAQNERLNMLYSQLESEIRLCLAYTTRVDVNVEDIEREHRTMLRRLEAGDYDGTLRYLAKTMQAAAERVSRLLERNERLASPASA